MNHHKAVNHHEAVARDNQCPRLMQTKSRSPPSRLETSSQRVGPARQEAGAADATGGGLMV